MDLFPTLVEAAGVDLVPDLDGRSLLPHLAGSPVPGWRTHLVVSHHGNMYGLCTMRAVVKERFKYVYYPYDIAELYDRDEDPWELDNRIDDPDLADVKSEMHSLLARHQRESGDLFNMGRDIGRDWRLVSAVA
jgi:arylsulfatase A-like enzyme